MIVVGNLVLHDGFVYVLMVQRGPGGEWYVEGVYANEELACERGERWRRLYQDGKCAVRRYTVFF